MVQTELPQVEEFAKKLQESWKHAAQAIEESQRNMKRQFDKRRRNPQGLKVGEHVWLENKNIQSNRPSKKLDNKRYRPFKITKDIGLGAFQLELPEGWMIHNVFNENLLTRCVEPKFKRQHKEPAPLLRSTPPGDNMGNRYDDMIGCATCYLSQHLM